MVDPVTWETASAWVTLEGIKFLYSQAAEVAKAWRERHQTPDDSPEIEVPILPNSLLDKIPPSSQIDTEILNIQGPSLIRLLAALTPYAQGWTEIRQNDSELGNVVANLRDLLEQVYQMRLTHHDEIRPATGSQISVEQSLGTIDGSAIGVEGAIADGSRLTVVQRAENVSKNGSIIGYRGQINK